MKLTKFEHACFVVEENGQSLIVDPGDWTRDFVIPQNPVAVIVTHEHGDHLDVEWLQKIREAYPDIVIIIPKGIESKLGDIATQPVIPNEGMRIGNFELEFFGGEHARITKDWQIVPNLGVMINSKIYYPGDSFSLPEGKTVNALFVPASAPWMKIAEATEFIETIKPQIAFPTHDAILSDAGKSAADKWLSLSAEKVGTKYQRLVKPLEIS